MVEKITNDLESALLDLNKQEKKYYDLLAKLNEIDFKLFEKQCELINKGLVSGRNKETRDAQMWKHTKELQEEKNKLKQEVDQAKLVYQQASRKYEQICLIARISASA